MKRSSGLTLIELLVATVLSAILMVLLGGVLRSVAQQRRWAAHQYQRAPSVCILRAQLQRDLENATSVAASSHAVRLSGLLAEDPISGRFLQRPAEVVYQVEPVAGTPCLVRTVVETMGGRGRRARRTLLWAGAGRISARWFRMREEPSGKESAVPTMPQSAELVVYDTGGRVLCRVNVVR